MGEWKVKENDAEGEVARARRWSSMKTWTARRAVAAYAGIISRIIPRIFAG